MPSSNNYKQTLINFMNWRDEPEENHRYNNDTEFEQQKLLGIQPSSKTNILCNCPLACALRNFLRTYDVNTHKYTQLRHFVRKYTMLCAKLHKFLRKRYTKLFLSFAPYVV